MEFYNKEFFKSIEENLKKKKEKVNGELFVDLETFEKQNNIIENFIKEKGLIIYGGTSMNKFLPEGKKIYSDEIGILTDYDVHSYEPKKNAIELANKLFQAGFEYVNVRDGVTPGVFKIFCNFQPAVDFAYMPRKVLEDLPYDTFDGLHYSNPVHLKIDLYFSLTNPRQALFRWEKDYKRLELLEQEFPYNQPADCRVEKKPEINFYPIQNFIYNFMQKEDVLITGDLAYMFYMNKSGLQEFHKPDMKYIEVMSSKPLVLLKKLKQKLKPEVVIKEFNPFLRHIPRRYVVALKSNPLNILAIVYDLEEHCVPFQTENDIKYVSFDYLLFFYSGFKYLAKRYKLKLYENSLCCLYYLMEGRSHYFAKHKKDKLSFSPFRSCIIYCEGKEPNLLRMHKINLWNKKRFDYKPAKRKELLEPDAIGSGSVKNISGEFSKDIFV